MIVLDASAALEWLLQTPTGQRVGKRLFTPGETLHAPHLLDVEVIQALRRTVRLGYVMVPEAELALLDLRDMKLQRYPHTHLLERAWDLKNNLSAYDAVYIALAEALDAPLLTCDRKLASASAHSAQVELI